MTSYIGRHAELYDIFYSEKEYKKETAFVHRCLQQYSIKPTGKILELACGTGNHAFELEKFGYNIIAIDYSKDMLSCAKQKAIQLNSKIDFRQQDMRVLNIQERPFDAIICLFDSLGYVETNSAISQTLLRIREHLHSTGVFIFEFWHAGAMIRHFDPVRVKRWHTENRDIIRISETELDYSIQLGIVKYTILESVDGNNYKSIIETQKNRFFLLQEMNALLSMNGFTLIKYYNGYSFQENIDDNAWHIIAIARLNMGTQGSDCQ
jgi:SAM-dependent methyltransferase